MHTDSPTIAFQHLHGLRFQYRGSQASGLYRLYDLDVFPFSVALPHIARAMPHSQNLQLLHLANTGNPLLRPVFCEPNKQNHYRYPHPIFPDTVVQYLVSSLVGLPRAHLGSA